MDWPSSPFSPILYTSKSIINHHPTRPHGPSPAVGNHHLHQTKNPTRLFSFLLAPACRASFNSLALPPLSLFSFCLHLFHPSIHPSIQPSNHYFVLDTHSFIEFISSTHRRSITTRFSLFFVHCELAHDGHCCLPQHRTTRTRNRQRNILTLLVSS